MKSCALNGNEKKGKQTSTRSERKEGKRGREGGGGKEMGHGSRPINDNNATNKPYRHTNAICRVVILYEQISIPMIHCGLGTSTLLHSG